jgi:hypothetical protein
MIGKKLGKINDIESLCDNYDSTINAISGFLLSSDEQERRNFLRSSWNGKQKIHHPASIEISKTASE